MPLSCPVGLPAMVAAFLGGYGPGAGVVIRAILGAVLLGVLCAAFKIGSFAAASGTGIIAGGVLRGRGNAQVLLKQWSGPVRSVLSLPGVLSRVRHILIRAVIPGSCSPAAAAAAGAGSVPDEPGAQLVACCGPWRAREGTAG